MSSLHVHRGPGPSANATVPLDAVARSDLPRPDAVGHRVVHGGLHDEPAAILTSALRDELHALIPLAPLHQPAALHGIDVATTRFTGVPQVACFDTSFHRRMPETAQRFPLPAEFWNEGVRRYGFHGISYSYVVEELGAHLGSRAVIAHLGNGASMVALEDGEPLDTSMGLTRRAGSSWVPGLVMSTPAS